MDDYYPEAAQSLEKVAGGRLSVRKQIELRLASAQKELQACNELLELLNRNPDIERFQDLMSRRHL